MIFIDFCLLRGPYCEVSYLLAGALIYINLDLGTVHDSVIWNLLFERPFRFIG